jgi:hypothetical protein
MTNAVDRIVLFGVGLTVAECADVAQLPVGELLARLASGMSPEDAMSGHVGRRGKRAVPLSGHRYERLVVLHVVERRSGGNVWLCRCDCGNERRVARGNLRSGVTRSCGCLNREVMTNRDRVELGGQRFGRLEVLRAYSENGRTGGTRWLCRCDCGNEKDVLAASLVSGKTKSCGCLNREETSQRLSVDLTGQVFGKLTAVRVGNRVGPAGLIGWVCRCECGKEPTISVASLRNGNTTSCGCVNTARLVDLRKSRARRVLVFGLEMSVVDLAGLCKLNRSTVHKALARGVSPEDVLCLMPRSSGRR